MSVYALDAGIAGQQLRGPDGAYALHSGDVVRRITAEREYVHDLGRGGYFPFPADFRLSENLVVGAGLAGLVLQYVRADKLAVILVRSDHVDVQSVGGETDGRRTYHVVGFVVRNHEHRDVHRPDYSAEGF